MTDDVSRSGRLCRPIAPVVDFLMGLAARPVLGVFLGIE